VINKHWTDSTFQRSNKQSPGLVPTPQIDSSTRTYIRKILNWNKIYSSTGGATSMAGRPLRRWPSRQPRLTGDRDRSSAPAVPNRPNSWRANELNRPPPSPLRSPRPTRPKGWRRLLPMPTRTDLPSCARRPESSTTPCRSSVVDSLLAAAWSGHVARRRHLFFVPKLGRAGICPCVDRLEAAYMVRTCSAAACVLWSYARPLIVGQKRLTSRQHQLNLQRLFERDKTEFSLVWMSNPHQ
jgi:hypothetical protein